MPNLLNIFVCIVAVKDASRRDESSKGEAALDVLVLRRGIRLSFVCWNPRQVEQPVLLGQGPRIVPIPSSCVLFDINMLDYRSSGRVEEKKRGSMKNGYLERGCNGKRSPLPMDEIRSTLGMHMIMTKNTTLIPKNS